MKRLVEEVTDDGLDSLFGEVVQIWCLNYIYTGKLVGVNEHDICLSNPSVVYETGALEKPCFKDAQPYGVEELFVRTACIESYGKVVPSER